MNTELVTCVMLHKEDTDEVLVQNRTKKYKGWSFPGGHVEKGESFADCAIREVKEETGLCIDSLSYCGLVHWANTQNDDRYLCYMYKSKDFHGSLIENGEEGEQFWVKREQLLAAPDAKFSCVHYAKSPLFHLPNVYSEVFILWNEQSENYVVEYK